MNLNKTAFVNILSAFLNNEQAKYCPEADYAEIIHLAGIHNVTGIAVRQIMNFSPEEQDKITNLSILKQQLGHTVINYEQKISIKKRLVRDLEDAGIDYIFVKGASIRELYPIPALRTSGDTDLFFREDDYEKIKQLYSDKGFSFDTVNKNVITFMMDSDEIELHCESDFDNPYFKEIFKTAHHTGKHEYVLSLEDQLLYVLCHIAKHFKHCGAGIRMFMDADVLLRHIENFDINKFLLKCSRADIDIFAKAALALCREWFNTPVDINFDLNKNGLREMFENTVIDGGSFGFEKRNLGDFYVNKAMSQSGKNGFISKISAIMLLIFPSAEHLKNTYIYCAKRPYLLPLAWFNRLFDGIFKRGKHSQNTLKQIIETDKYTEDYWKLLQELDIK